MPRFFAKINLGIWTDDDFLDLDPEERSFLIASWSRSEVNNAGVGPWRPEEMTDLISRASTADDVRRVGASLQAKRFLVIDERTREVLMRSYVRHDDVVRQPKMAVAFVTAFESVKSPELRQTIANEVHRLYAEAYQDSGGDPERMPAAFKAAKPGARNRLLDMMRKNPATVHPAMLARWARGSRAAALTAAEEFAEQFAAGQVPAVPGLGSLPEPAVEPLPAPPADTLAAMSPDLGGYPSAYPIDRVSEGYPEAIGMGSGGPIPTTTATTTKRSKDSSPNASVRDERDRASDGVLPLLIAVPATAPGTGTTTGGKPKSGRRKSPADHTYDAAFERFWTAYGKKGGKRAAAAEWHWALERADPAVILAAVPAYVACTPNPRYRKDAERWLKTDGWASNPVDYSGGPPLPKAAGRGVIPDHNPATAEGYAVAAGQRL